ncbi:MAG TPA: hypothetical protein VEL82_06705 [Thermoplasmata archaeon]|nr:hypothetical protein [Thermoplasmata archaeon]
MPSTPIAPIESERAAGAGPDVGDPHAPFATPIAIGGFELSLDTAPIDLLESVARSMTAQRLDDWFSSVPGTDELAILSTCHRVEIVVLARFPDTLERWLEVLPGPRERWRRSEGRATVRHLFRVAAGRESLALGEAEARRQVRTAGFGVRSRHPRPVLRELFQAAARAADDAHPSVPSSRSIAAIAVQRLLALVPGEAPRVLVIGSGTVGRQVAEGLGDRARVTLVYHVRPPEPEFLARTGAGAVPLAALGEALGECDAIVTAAKFGDHGLGAADLPPDRRLVVVDLGMPRNIDPAVRGRSNVRLVDLEELRAFAEGPRALEAPDPRIDELAEHYGDRLDRLLLEPWIDAFRRATEEVRRGELDRARAYLGVLAPGQEAAIDRLTRRLVTRLLEAPTERLRAIPAGPEGDRQRRLALEFLRPAHP